jgi:hypothetical protein
MTQDTADSATTFFCDFTPESLPLLLTSREPTFSSPPQTLTALTNSGRRPKSDIWLHFTKATDYKTTKKATCMHCAKTFVASNGSTSSMRIHLHSHHADVFPTPAGAESLDG